LNVGGLASDNFGSAAELGVAFVCAWALFGFELCVLQAEAKQSTVTTGTRNSLFMFFSLLTQGDFPG
jgi:hypothetical protein